MYLMCVAQRTRDIVLRPRILVQGGLLPTLDA